MGLLHTALKLVLWRRMGYYYLPATHPAIKTSGATSPQRSAAALPPFPLTPSLSSYMSRAQPDSELHTIHSATQTQDSLCSLLRYRFAPHPLDIPPLGASFSFETIFFVNGHLCLERGACEWTTA